MSMTRSFAVLTLGGLEDLHALLGAPWLAAAPHGLQSVVTDG